jgi:hypothetical protein
VLSLAYPGTLRKKEFVDRFTLCQVQEFGLNSEGLPATHFTYGDKMHLACIENGYGEQVEFTYELWHNDDNIEDEHKKQAEATCVGE